MTLAKSSLTVATKAEWCLTCKSSSHQVTQWSPYLGWGLQCQAVIYHPNWRIRWRLINWIGRWEWSYWVTSLWPYASPWDWMYTYVNKLMLTLTHRQCKSSSYRLIWRPVLIVLLWKSAFSSLPLMKDLVMLLFAALTERTLRQLL